MMIQKRNQELFPKKSSFLLQGKNTFFSVFHLFHYRKNFFLTIFINLFLNDMILEKEIINTSKKGTLNENKDKYNIHGKNKMKNFPQKCRRINSKQTNFSSLLISLFLLFVNYELAKSFSGQYGDKLKLFEKKNTIKYLLKNNRTKDFARQNFFSKFSLFSHEINNEEENENIGILKKITSVFPFSQFISIKFLSLKKKLKIISRENVKPNSLLIKGRITDEETSNSNVNVVENVREEDSDILFEKEIKKKKLLEKTKIAENSNIEKIENNNVNNVNDDNSLSNQIKENNDNNHYNLSSVPKGNSPIYHHSTLVSFRTAGNWKEKRKSWGKYKKNTGWRDPYRDGEDSVIEGGGTFFWRFFAEMMCSNDIGRGDFRRGSDEENKNSCNNHGENVEEGEKDGDKEENREHECEIKKEDNFQEGVIGFIQSSSGTFFVRNVESSFDFTEDSSDELNQNKDMLIEKQLLKSIRNYANPTRPKF